MKIRCLEVGPFESNCYIVTGDGDRALVVDPGADVSRIRALLRSLKTIPAAVLLTHGHADHLGALSELLADAPLPVYMHPADLAWAFSAANQILPYYPPPADTPPDARPVNDGDTLELAGLALTILAAPGHTPGGVCFHFRETGDLFTGDTLFHGSVGRTDLPGGDSTVLTATLLRLARLPPETRVWPGHGADTTVGEELRTNPFLAHLSR